MIPENEEKPERGKRERFRYLAEKRTQTVLKKLQVLGNCANRSNYEYSEEEVAKIFAAIEQQLALIRAKFERRKDIDFRL